MKMSQGTGNYPKPQPPPCKELNKVDIIVSMREYPVISGMNGTRQITTITADLRIFNID